MLFNRNPKRRNRVQRTIVIIQKPQKLSRKIIDLPVPCPKGLNGTHLPYLMNFHRASANNSGEPTGIFRCPICGAQSIYALHSQTRKPIRIG